MQLYLDDGQLVEASSFKQAEEFIDSFELYVSIGMIIDIAACIPIYKTFISNNWKKDGF